MNDTVRNILEAIGVSLILGATLFALILALPDAWTGIAFAAIVGVGLIAASQLARREEEDAE